MSESATHKIAIVIPCYKVTQHIQDVIKAVPKDITYIICVDDACPDGSGDFIEKHIREKRVNVVRNAENQGVGGAMVVGYKAALEKGADILVKIDGDGQMDPALIPQFIEPIMSGQADYTKGNRFYRVEDVTQMPAIRIFGNAVLSFMTKLSSGYWNLFDPTNGYTAIHADVLREIPLENLDKRYFFESDLLFRLNTLRAVVTDIPMKAVYGDEASNLKIGKIIGPFLISHLKNFCKRLFYCYFLRDFNIASIEFLLGLPLLVFGIVFGITQWIESNTTGLPATSGTVMLSALPIIVGTQLLLSFLQYDIQSVPRTALHKLRSNR